MLSTAISAARRSISKPAVLAAAGARLKHTLPDLPYDFHALEPYISADIMKLHHEKHHATYVNNLNITEDKLNEAITKNNISAIIGLQPALKFNGGGHLNHSIFWKCLSPTGGGEPEGDLMTVIKASFQSFEEMKAELVTACVSLQGSGWGWVGYNPASGRCRIAACANQDPLQATTGLVPLFGIDVWEHAYYLQYKNVRPDYVKAMFEIANWKEVACNLENARLNN
uniref:Superoxide dismutase n=1 Tax=Laternula elliptica TaxID=228457 RepID=C7DRQ4_LATEL|nr:manganese superoxide dismutase [Laternula elliptica]